MLDELKKQPLKKEMWKAANILPEVEKALQIRCKSVGVCVRNYSQVGYEGLQVVNGHIWLYLLESCT